jgi:hypothetical protein
MGLDMYLTREHFVGGQYDHLEATGGVDIRTADGPLVLDAKKVSSIVEQVGYWRKANQIHKWFVDKVQDGKDECQRSYVSRDQLKELRDLCAESLKHKDSGKLPTQSGFFFGSTEIDDYYWEDLKYTLDLLKGLDLDSQDYRVSYYYQASW